MHRLELAPDEDILEAWWFTRILKFDEQGNVQPFLNRSEEDTVYMGEQMKINGTELTLTREPLEEDGDYYCMFELTDTQGNAAYSPLIPLE